MGCGTRRGISRAQSVEGTTRRFRNPRIRSRFAAPPRTGSDHEMSLDRVRMGIVGVGNIATLNVPGYLEHEQCDVIALCDPRPEVLERRQQEWDVARGYTDLAALLADDEIDAVEILGPTPLHAEHSIAALEAGKHVSVQKPIANTVSDARRMLDAARATGKTLRVAEHCCHYPPLVK